MPLCCVSVVFFHPSRRLEVRSCSHFLVFQEEVYSSSQRVLVTGATGLLGRAVYKEFHNNDWDTLGCGYTRARPRFLSCNLLDEEDVREVIQSFQVLTSSLHSVWLFVVFSSDIRFPLMPSTFYAHSPM